MSKEIWKPIPQLEDYFEVSTLGNVRNKRTNRLIIGDVNNFGYYRVAMYVNGKQTRWFRHRLVATVFIENPQNKKFVNHIDGDKSNNTITNLEWVTQSENEKHAFRTGLKRKTNKPFNVYYICGKTETFNTQKEFGYCVGKCQADISHIIRNKLFHRLPNVLKIEFIA